MISADNYPMSEAGHLHSGASRKKFSDRLKINRSIADITSSKNAPFLNVMQKPKKTGGALHLIGIASFFSKKAKRRKVNQTGFFCDCRKNCRGVKLPIGSED